MLNLDTALVQWCICLATMILFVEKVLATCVHWRDLFARQDKDAIHRLEMRVEGVTRGCGALAPLMATTCEPTQATGAAVRYPSARNHGLGVHCHPNPPEPPKPSISRARRWISAKVSPWHVYGTLGPLVQPPGLAAGQPPTAQAGSISGKSQLRCRRTSTRPTHARAKASARSSFSPGGARNVLPSMPASWSSVAK
jgi:hypothetical protein